VGCGDGRILNRLDGKYECIGLDISNEALKYVKTKKIHDSLENLPFADNKL
jgi:ubiquinone/menaquinone biosynthesis C-methylase UbiE